MKMLNNILFVEKEIYYFGKKEVHNVLCIEKVSDTGDSYYVPLTYSSKGKDDKYYQTYIINDNIHCVIIDNLPTIYQVNKKSK